MHLAVQDNGIGLTEEQINRLFTKFGKIEWYGQGFDIITEGSGLGLHIEKKLLIYMVEKFGSNLEG
ncbi:MAG: ATP-binding protein [Candidatus Hodarchaeota archaeon]